MFQFMLIVRLLDSEVPSEYCTSAPSRPPEVQPRLAASGGYVSLIFSMLPHDWSSIWFHTGKLIVRAIIVPSGFLAWTMSARIIAPGLSCLPVDKRASLTVLYCCCPMVTGGFASTTCSKCCGSITTEVPLVTSRLNVFEVPSLVSLYTVGTSGHCWYHSSRTYLATIAGDLKVNMNLIGACGVALPMPSARTPTARLVSPTVPVVTGSQLSSTERSWST